MATFGKPAKLKAVRMSAKVAAKQATPKVRKPPAVHQPRATFTTNPRPAAPSKGWVANSPAARAAPAPVAQGLPFDARLEQITSQATNRWADTTADVGLRRTMLKQDYGFDDVSNPFNRAAMLQKAYNEGQAGQTNSDAAAGHLYSGSLQTALGENTHRYDRSKDQLRRDYDAALAAMAKEEADALRDREETVSDAQQDAVYDAETFDPGVGGDEEAQGGGGAPPGQAPVGVQYSGPNTYAPAAPISPQVYQQVVQATQNRPQVQVTGSYGKPGTGGTPSARETEVRNALMAHDKNWNQRPRLLAELERLRAQPSVPVYAPQAQMSADAMRDAQYGAQPGSTAYARSMGWL